MTAFQVSMAAAGWRPGDAFPTGGELAAASGAAFITVVLCQVANVFACRSSSHWPGSLGWTSNRLLIPAAAIGLAISLAALLVGPIAHQLDQAAPPAWGWTIAVASMPLLLAVDAVDKRHRRVRRDGRSHAVRSRR
jgi:hypothetical protein